MIFNELTCLLYKVLIFIILPLYVFLINKKYKRLMNQIKIGNFNNYIYYESDEYIHTDSD